MASKKDWKRKFILRDVTLVCWNGWKQTYDTLDQFVYHYLDKFINGLDSTRLKRGSWTNWNDDYGNYYTFVTGCDYNLLDKYGNIIPLWKIYETWEHWKPIKEVIEKRKKIDSRRRIENKIRKWRKKAVPFRMAPIPKTGKCRGYSGFRFNVNYFGALRESVNNHDGDLRQYNIQIRGKRTRRNLVNPWDDLKRSNGYVKSWKKHRNAQWRKQKQSFKNLELNEE